MRILPHNLPILTRPRLALIRVDNQIPRLRIILPALEVHKTPLHPARKPRSTPTSQAAGLDFGDEPVVAFEDHLFGFVPVAVFHGRLEVGAVVAVDVLEDAVLVLQRAGVGGGGRGILDCGHGSFLLAILGGGGVLLCCG